MTQQTKRLYEDVNCWSRLEAPATW